jgi:hypothetical protein
MLVALGAVPSIKLHEQRTTVLMLDVPFQTQFAIAAAKRVGKLRFPSGRPLIFFPTGSSVWLSMHYTSEQT